VTGSGHPLNGGLRGYYQGKLPLVLRATGNGQKLLETMSSLQWHPARGPYNLY
jgi:hypothetical protein